MIMLHIGDTVYEQDVLSLLGPTTYYFEKVIVDVVDAVNGIVRTYEPGIADASNREKEERLSGLYVKTQDGFQWLGNKAYEICA